MLKLKDNWVVNILLGEVLGVGLEGRSSPMFHTSHYKKGERLCI